MRILEKRFISIISVINTIAIKGPMPETLVSISIDFLYFGLFCSSAILLLVSKYTVFTFSNCSIIRSSLTLAFPFISSHSFSHLTNPFVQRFSYCSGSVTPNWNNKLLIWFLHLVISFTKIKWYLTRLLSASLSISGI